MYAIFPFLNEICNTAKKNSERRWKYSWSYIIIGVGAILLYCIGTYLLVTKCPASCAVPSLCFFTFVLAALLSFLPTVSSSRLSDISSVESVIASYSPAQIDFLLQETDHYLADTNPNTRLIFSSIASVITGIFTHYFTSSAADTLRFSIVFIIFAPYVVAFVSLIFAAGKRSYAKDLRRLLAYRKLEALEITQKTDTAVL